MPRGFNNEANPKWKGDKVSYNGLHKWVNRYKGKPIFCNECGRKDKRRYEWANISQEYKRDLSDYRSLCVSCHRKEAFKLGAKVWNKGTKGLVRPNSGSFKKGHKLNRGKYRVKNPSYQTAYMRNYRKKFVEVRIKET